MKFYIRISVLAKPLDKRLALFKGIVLSTFVLFIWIIKSVFSWKLLECKKVTFRNKSSTYLYISGWEAAKSKALIIFCLFVKHCFCKILGLQLCFEIDGLKKWEQPERMPLLVPFVLPLSHLFPFTSPYLPFIVAVQCNKHLLTSH